MDPKCLLTSTDLQTRRARCQHQLSFLFIFFSEARAEIKPFDRFWHTMAQNARNHAWMCLFGVKIFNFNIWHLFTPKMSNFAPKIAISSQNNETWKEVQVYQKQLNQWNWKFDTMLRTWNSVLRCNMMTSQQIQYGGRPPYWKSYFGYISATRLRFARDLWRVTNVLWLIDWLIYCSINAKFGTL